MSLQLPRFSKKLPFGRQHFLEVLQNLRFYKSKYAILVDDIKGVLVNGTTGFDLRQAAGWTIELLVDKAVFVKAANYP